MVTAEDFFHFAERRRVSYFLSPVTYWYFLYYFGYDFWLQIAVIMTSVAATFLFTEKEILESIKEDLQERLDSGQYTLAMNTRTDILNNYKNASIWLQFETAMLIIWGESILFAVYYYLFIISWNVDFWLSVLGFANIIYLLMFISDKIYDVKYRRHYLDS
jgi:hypothetical protein